jgi:trans-2,3-dihydro-3-hydroxyanthranilate isomerase
MPKIRFHTADVFTDTLFGGNPVAVIPDATGLDARAMQLVAREFNYSETTFCLPPEDPAHTRRVRIFTPAVEMPFAGHPTLGTAFVLASIGAIPIDGENTRIVLEEGVGPVPVTIRSVGGRPVFGELTAAKLPEEGPEPPSRAELATLLSLREGDLLSGEWSAQTFSCGLPFLFVPLAGIDAVGRARIDPSQWQTLSAASPLPSIAVFCRETETRDADLHVRVFAPNVGIAEDPATGSAAAAIAGYLARREKRGSDTLRWAIEQGIEVGRPSRIDVEADRQDGEVTEVRVGGTSVLVSEGTMEAS